MSSEITPAVTLDIGHPEYSHDTLSERARFAQRVLAEPDLRYQVSGLTKQVHTDRVSDLGLGYYQFPFVQVSEVLRQMNLDHTSGDWQRQAAARALLDGCLETRDNLEKSSSADDVDVSGGALAKLPFELQLVAIAKAFSGDSGCAYYATALQNGSPQVDLLINYAQQKLGMTPFEAEHLRQAVTVVNGTEIVKEHISHAWWNQPIDKGTFPRTIVGRAAPNEGFYLPDMVEDAVRNAYYDDAWMARHVDKSSAVADASLQMGGVIVDLCDFDEDASSFWGAYGMSSLLLQEAFVERTEGYSGAVGQIVSQRAMRADDQIYEQYLYARDCLENLCGHANFSREGMRLAVCSMAQQVARTTERELVRGGAQDRSGRLRTLGKMYIDVREYDDTDLSDRILQAAPLLASHIREIADPWTYRFS